MTKTKQLIHASFDENFMIVEGIIEDCSKVFSNDMNIALSVGILKQMATDELSKLLQGRSCSSTVLGLKVIHEEVFKRFI